MEVVLTIRDRLGGEEVVELGYDWCEEDVVKPIEAARTRNGGRGYVLVEGVSADPISGYLVWEVERIVIKHDWSDVLSEFVWSAHPSRG